MNHRFAALRGWKLLLLILAVVLVTTEPGFLLGVLIDRSPLPTPTELVSVAAGSLFVSLCTYTAITASRRTR